MKKTWFISFAILGTFFSFFCSCNHGGKCNLTTNDSDIICNKYIADHKAKLADSIEYLKKNKRHPFDGPGGLTQGSTLPADLRTYTVTTTVDKGQPMAIRVFNGRRLLGQPYSDTIDVTTGSNMISNYAKTGYTTTDADYFLFDAYTLYSFIQTQTNVQDIMMRLARDKNNNNNLTLIIYGRTNDNKSILIGATTNGYLEHCYPCPECGDE